MGQSDSTMSKHPFKNAAAKFDADTISELKKNWSNNVGHSLIEANFSQFCKMLPQLSSSECEPLFHVYDVNKNGTILWSEFVAVNALITKGTLDEKVELVFHAFDANSNGKISKKEFGKAVTYFSDKGGDGFIDKVLQRAILMVMAPFHWMNLEIG